MRTSLLIAVKDLRQRIRDRSFFIFGAIVPFTLTFIFSLLLGPVTSSAPVTADLALIDADDSPMSAGLRLALDGAEQAGVVNWSTLETEALARERIAAGELDAAIVLPAGFGAAVIAGGSPEITVIGSADEGPAAQVAESVAAGYASRLRSAVWAAAALAAAGEPVIPAVLFVQVAAVPEALTLSSVPTSDRQLDFTTYYAAGMAVFFVFFIVQFGVTGLLDEEREGTMTRLLAAPIGRRSILGGKVLSSVIIGVLSMVVLAVASTLVMGADWGAPLAVLILIVAVVAAAAGVLMLVAGLARSAEAAGNLQSMVAITLGALGGAFFQLPQRGGLLAVIQGASPHHWFMQGMADLAAGGGVGALGNELLAIALFAVVTGTIGWFALERRLTR